LTSAQSIYVNGWVKALNGDLTLHAGHDVYNNWGSQLLASDNVNITAGHDITNNGVIDPIQVNLTAGHDIINNGLVEGDAISFNAGHNIYNAGQIGTDASDIVSLYAGRDLRVTGSGSVFGSRIGTFAGRDIRNNGQIGNFNTTLLVQMADRDIHNNGLALGENVLAFANRDLNNAGVMLGVNILAGAGRNLNNNGAVVGETVLALAGRDLNNTGVLYGSSLLFAAAQRDLNNTGGMFSENILGYAGRDLNNAGVIDAGVLNTLHAERNLNVTGTGYVGGQQIYAEAENDINIAGQVGNAGTLLASLNAGHDVNVTSTESGDCCDPNGPTASQAGRVFGDTVEVYAANNVNVDGYVGDGRPDSTTNVTANNNITGRGLFSGNTVNLRSLNGNIGSAAQHVRTAANKLALNAAYGSVYADQLGSVSLLDSTAANIFALKVFKACGAPEGTKANLNIDGNVSGATVFLETDNGNIVSTGLTSGGHVHFTAHGGSIIDGNGDALNLLATGDSSLWADGTIGSLRDPFDVNVGGKLFVGAGGSDRGISIVINGTTGDNTLNPLNVPPGAVIFNGQYLFGNGPVREVLQRGVPYMLQDYRNMTNPLFTTAVNTSGKLLKPGALRNVQAEIINKWQQPEPFDLRLIQSEEQGEAYELLMNH
jgi:hypothetical protein